MSVGTLRRTSVKIIFNKISLITYYHILLRLYYFCHFRIVVEMHKKRTANAVCEGSFANSFANPSLTRTFTALTHSVGT